MKLVLYRRFLSSGRIGSWPMLSLPSSKTSTRNHDNVPSSFGSGLKRQLSSKPTPLNNFMSSIKTAMIQQRQFRIPFISKPKKKYQPIELGEDNLTVSFTLSDLAGHCSFLFLANSYLENDFWYLRIYAMSGLSLSIVFQYYREKPLWIPIRWNSLFLLINFVMIMFIIKEEHEAEKIPDEQKQIFEQLFSAKGMKPVDFLHFMSIAHRAVVKKGEKVVSQGEKHGRVHLVQSGSFAVARSNLKTGKVTSATVKIGNAQFIGVMSFLAWESEKRSREVTRKKKLLKEQQELLENSDPEWPILSISRPSDNPFANSSSLKKNNDNNAVLTSSASNSGGNDTQGLADVVALEDSVIYSWSFKDLHNLLSMEPNVGLVFESIISEDLSKKMASSWREEPKMRYKEVLNAVITDDEVLYIIFDWFLFNA